MQDQDWFCKTKTAHSRPTVQELLCIFYWKTKINYEWTRPKFTLQNQDRTVYYKTKTENLLCKTKADIVVWKYSPALFPTQKFARPPSALFSNKITGSKI